MPPVRAEWTFFSNTSKKSHACRLQQQQVVVLGFPGIGINRDHKSKREQTVPRSPKRDSSSRTSNSSPRAAETRPAAATCRLRNILVRCITSGVKKRVSHQLTHPRPHRSPMYRYRCILWYRCILLHAEHTRTCNTHEKKVAPSVKSHGVVV